MNLLDQYIFQLERFTSIRPSTILEIGALDAEYSKRLSAHFRVPSNKVVVVEPNPELANVLKESGFVYIQAALSMYSGEASFQVVKNQEKEKIGCSSLKRREDGWEAQLIIDKIAVRTISGIELLAQLPEPIDLCIIDVEGMAFEVIESFGDKLSRIKSLLVECEHKPIFKGQHLYEDVESLLRKACFRQMAFAYEYAQQSNSVWVQEKYVKLDYCASCPSTFSYA